MRLECVNRKFQRCMVKELNAHPEPLQLDYWKHNLNGHNVTKDHILSALQSFAKKAKFSTIRVRIGSACVPERMEQLDRILSLLLSQNQCLTKVTSFATDSSCSQANLYNFLNKCGKLSIVKLDFFVRPLNSERGSYPTFPLDLCHLLNDKRLTELELHPFRYHQGLVEVLEGIQPNALRKVVLSFDEMPVLNSVELVNALNSKAGSTLEELDMAFNLVEAHLAELFESLARLPVLRKCNIDCSFRKNGNQLVSAATSLFAMCDIKIRVTVDRDSFFFRASGCRMVQMIQQIQNVHPGLRVDFSAGSAMILSLGNASIRKSFATEVEDCGEQCGQCQSFYPTLLNFLHSRAEHAAANFVEGQDLLDWQLDRCRVGQIVDDLNSETGTYSIWSALSAEQSDDEQSVTINFETRIMEDYHLFNITVSCGRCLSNGCMKC